MAEKNPKTEQPEQTPHQQHEHQKQANTGGSAQQHGKSSQFATSAQHREDLPAGSPPKDISIDQIQKLIEQFGAMSPILFSLLRQVADLFRQRPVMGRAVDAKPGDCPSLETYVNQMREAHTHLGDDINRLAQSKDCDQEMVGHIQSHLVHMLASTMALCHCSQIKDQERQEKAKQVH